jgi:putative endonuclease
MKTFTSKSQKTGKIGEDLATLFLMKHGFSVIERNFTKPYEEIDVVAYKNTVFHFVEVKTVSCVTNQISQSIRPEENMHSWKFRKFSRTVEAYLLQKDITNNWQIDLITVYLDDAKRQGRVAYFPNLIF